MTEARKPAITTSGLDPKIARALEPIRQTLEMLTGVRSNVRELKGLGKDASQEQIVNAINAIMARLNASGKA